jgi:hypothetical protein
LLSGTVAVKVVHKGKTPSLGKERLIAKERKMKIDRPQVN